MERTRSLASRAGLFAVGAVSVGLVGAIAWSITGRDDASSRAKDATSTTTATGAAGGAPLPAGLVEFRDESSGFAIAYPADWERLESSDSQVRLVVTRNRADSFLARVVTLDSAYGQEQLPQFQTLTDQLVKADQGAEILQGPKPVEVAGVPGFFYFYRFTDTASGQRGVHSHYYLVRDRTMFSFVFQALPEASFKELAPVFDQIVSTFRRL